MFSFSKHRKVGSRRPTPKLERRNAVKNIDYDAVASASSSFSSLSSPPAPELLRATRSLDLSPSCPNQTSFRIGGSIEGEVDLICRCLGLSGPEDFAIPAAAWEASRAHRSSSDLLPRSRLNPTSQDPTPSTSSTVQDPTPSVEIRVSEDEPIKKIGGGGDGGIKGVRPPSLTPPATISTLSPSPTMSRSSANPSPSSVLAPPPSISLPVLEKVGSTWDLVRSFAPNDEEEEGRRRRSFDSEKEEEEEEEGGGIRGGGNEEGEVTSEDVTSTSKVMFVVSENGRFKRNIKSWIRGERLGSGSYGTVYEGISQ